MPITHFHGTHRSSCFGNFFNKRVQLITTITTADLTFFLFIIFKRKLYQLTQYVAVMQQLNLIMMET